MVRTASIENNLKAAWWKAMTQLNDNIVGYRCRDFHAPAHLEGIGARRWLQRSDDRQQGFQKTLPRRPGYWKARQNNMKKDGQLKKRKHCSLKMGRLLSAEDLTGVRELIIAEGINVRYPARPTGRRCASST